MICNECGQENVAGARFCAFCGEKLAQKSRPAPAGDPFDARGDVRPLKDNPVQPRSGDASAPGSAQPPRPAPPKAGGTAQSPRQMPVNRSPRAADSDEAYRRPAARQADDVPQSAPAQRKPPAPKPSAKPASAPGPKAARARPQPKPVSKKPFKFDDEPEYEDESLYDDEDEYEEVGQSARKRVYAILSAIIVIAGLVVFVFFNPFSRSPDYLAQAEQHRARGDKASAEISYVNAYNAIKDGATIDLNHALRIAAGLESIESYTYAERIYNHLTALYPTRGEPYDRALALFAKLDEKEKYSGMAALREKNLYPNGTPTPTPQPTATPFTGLAPPVPSHPAGVYQNAFELSFTASEGANIHYTLNDTTPTASSPKYTGAILLESGTYKFRMIAIRGGELSAEWIGTYTVAPNGTVG